MRKPCNICGQLLSTHERRLHTTLGTMMRCGDKKRITGLCKRPYPSQNICEFCEKGGHKFLQYHHWDDKDPSLGIWVCSKCHLYCNIFEYWRLLDKYEWIKNKVKERREIGNTVKSTKA